MPACSQNLMSTAKESRAAKCAKMPSPPTALRQPTAHRKHDEMLLSNRRRFCHRSGSPLIVPQSMMEWKRCLAVIKGHHSNGRHRECATRCQDVLANMRNPDNVENAHLIFLHFYAATSLEMQCRSLHHASPARLGLLQEAQNHYRFASKLVSSEEQVVSHLSILSLSPSSTMIDSPGHSPTFSSRSVSTSLSSPCPSENAVQKDGRDDAENSDKTTQQNASEKKEVCIGQIVDCKPEDVALPTSKSKEGEEEEDDYDDDDDDDDDVDGATLSRPDSPTLGFDDWLGRSSPDPIIPPLRPLHTVSFKPVSVEQSGQPQTGAEDRVDEKEALLSSQLSSSLTKKTPYELCASVLRYRDLLISLQDQIKSHQLFIEEEAAQSQSPTRYFSRGNEEVRKIELQARIERLKATGWERKRFDVAKYEALRESAMVDMWA